MGTATYLPSCWLLDEQMSGLMTMIKARSVNPVDYDRKVRFWSDLVASSCLAEKNATFNIEMLKRRFRRGDTIPASLSIVIDNMMNSGDVAKLSDWKDQHSSWMGWGVNRLMKTGGWLLGSSTQPERYVHLPTIKKQADALVALYEREFRDEVDCTGEVVAYAELYDKSSDIVQTEENFEIILQYLEERGEVTVGSARNGEKILKFRDRRDNGPVRFTDADASVHDIRRSMNRLDKDIAALEGKIQRLDQETRAAIRGGEKTRAANLLRQKKRAEKDLGDKDSQYQKLLTMLHQIGSTKHNKDVLDAYKVGTAAFKATLDRHGLSPEKIDAAMDEVQEAVDEYHEIEDAIGQGVTVRSSVQDEELERELDELIGAQRQKEVVPELPTVPSARVGISDRDSEVSSGVPAAPVSDLSLEQRLNRLRQLAA